MISNAKYIIVGSVLVKDDPRDLDIRGILSKEDFQIQFGMNEKEFWKNLYTGEWTTEMYRWARVSVEDGHVLSIRLNSSLPVDFRYEPEGGL